MKPKRSFSLKSFGSMKLKPEVKRLRAHVWYSQQNFFRREKWIFVSLSFSFPFLGLISSKFSCLLWIIIPALTEVDALPPPEMPHVMSLSLLRRWEKGVDALPPPDLLEIHVPLSLCNRGVDTLPPPVRVIRIFSKYGGGNATPATEIETWPFSTSGGGNTSTSIRAGIIMQSRQEIF